EYIGVTPGQGYLTQQRAQALSNAGVSIFSIYEKEAMKDSSYFTSPPITADNPKGDARVQGALDAAKAFEAADQIGEPAGKAIYFGIDFDTGGSKDVLSAVLNYFEGIHDEVITRLLNGQKAYTIGVYGSGELLQFLQDQK